MAWGSAGSDRVASSSHAAVRRSGSSASVKSLLVNRLGCSIDSSFMRWSVSVTVAGAVSRQPRYISRVSAHLWGLRRLGLAGGGLALSLLAGGCSFSYQLDSLFEKNPVEPTGS